MDVKRSSPAFSTARPPAPTGGKVGVLIINLGTPEATDPGSVRRYLREFLSDPRVIELPRALWLPILNLAVLPLRSRRSGKAYARIWNREANESPLKTITRAQGEKLGAALAGEDIQVGWAMRYGKPSIADELQALIDGGCDRILLASLYPQYSATTTATAQDKAFAALARLRLQPAVRTLPAYYADPDYIEALAASIEAALARLDFEPEVLLASFHGLPEAYVTKGDPYRRHCEVTTELLRTRLGRNETSLPLSYQSRFGKAEWLKPYTAACVEDLARSGVKRLAVITPGFAADCIETLEEIGMENAEVFQHHGGERFAALPCLNDSSEGMQLLEALVRRELSGWL